MKIKADFHIHTHNSADSGSSASAIIEQARKVGLGVIAVTDHNTTKGALEVRSLAKGNPLVIAGQEVMTSSGEIIVLGVEKNIQKGMNLLDTCKIAKALDGFIIVSHPFDISRSGVGSEIISILDQIDAIETFNSRCLARRFNRKAEAFARSYEVPMVSGSDAHFPKEIGSSFTELEIEGELSESAVYKAILSEKTKIVGRRSGVMPHINTFTYKLRKKF